MQLPVLLLRPDWGASLSFAAVAARNLEKRGRRALAPPQGAAPKHEGRERPQRRLAKVWHPPPHSSLSLLLLLFLSLSLSLAAAFAVVVGVAPVPIP